MDIADSSHKVTNHVISRSPSEKALLVSNLVKSAKSGDLDSFDSLTLMFRERLYGVIYNMTFNHDDAADLTQDAFVKAFRSLSKFKEKASFFTWIYRIGVNLTLSYLKKKKSRKFFSFDQYVSDGVSVGVSVGVGVKLLVGVCVAV